MRCSLGTALLAVGLAAWGCATTGGDDQENNNNLNRNTNTNYNNNGNNGGNCQATCTDPDRICVGGDLEHQTCAPKCDGGSCDGSMTCCFGGCVDLKADPNNCGACGKYCGEGASCVNGICVDACNNMCTATQECCGGSCVDVMSDPNNCGQCGNVCDPTVANACTNGYCTCGMSAACTGGFTCCGDRGCRNLQNDVSNCGQCGHECAQGEVCVNGVCQCGGGQTCNAGEACCNGECVDIQNDDNNCGGCGNKCSDMTAGYTCNDGVCNCNGEICEPNPFGFGDPQCCDNDGCVNWGGNLGNFDEIFQGVKNCGSCGNDCAPGDFCIMGNCTSFGG